MKSACSLALCLVVGLAVLHGGAAESYYQKDSYQHGDSYQHQQQGCLKEHVPGYGIRKEQGFVLVGSQFFTCLPGYKPEKGSQAQATCHSNGYWTIDIDCKKEEYNYGSNTYNSNSYDSKSYDSKTYNKDSSYSSGSSYSSSSYKSGVLRPWGQCGGKSAECYNGVGPCVDAVWTNVYCPSGQKCYRQSEYYYQCLPDNGNSYTSNYQPPKTNNYNGEYKPQNSGYNQQQQQVYGRL